MKNSYSNSVVKCKITTPLKQPSKHHNMDSSSLLSSLSIENCNIVFIKSGDIINEEGKFIKRSINKKEIPTYKNGRFGKDKIKYRQVSLYFIEYLMMSFDLGIKEVKIISKCIGSINVKSYDDNHRYSDTTGGSFLLLDNKILNEYFEAAVYRDSNKKIKRGYKLKNNSGLDFSLFNYLMDLNDVVHIPNLNHFLSIKINDFIKMELHSQLQLLRSLAVVKANTLYFNLNTIQDIGNYGRRYNILNTLPRACRTKISTMKGLDMVTALQTIVASLCTDLELKYTKHYINNKQQVRDAISKEMNWTLEETKMEITSIYQGRRYTKKYAKIKEFFDERDLISNYLFAKRFDDTEVVKYAIKRTNEKLLSKYPKSRLSVKSYNNFTTTEQFKIRNTFMFFYWTYYEREIQNIICKYFKYPITLHDAVYAQNINELKDLDITKIETAIFEETAIRIKLSL